MILNLEKYVQTLAGVQFTELSAQHGHRCLETGRFIGHCHYTIAARRLAVQALNTARPQVHGPDMGRNEWSNSCAGPSATEPFPPGDFMNTLSLSGGARRTPPAPGHA